MKAIEFYTTLEGEVTMRPIGEAEKLFISLNTVNNHRKNSFRKVGVHSMAEFMRYAMTNNLFK